jgi:hypothetical protein
MGLTILASKICGSLYWNIDSTTNFVQGNSILQLTSFLSSLNFYLKKKRGGAVPWFLPSVSLTSNPKTNVVSDKQNLDQMEMVFLLTFLLYYIRINKAVILHMTSHFGNSKRSEGWGSMLEPRDLVLLPLFSRERTFIPRMQLITCSAHKHSSLEVRCISKRYRMLFRHTCNDIHWLRGFCVPDICPVTWKRANRSICLVIKL